jgi:hypothetical protein
VPAALAADHPGITLQVSAPALDADSELVLLLQRLGCGGLKGLRGRYQAGIPVLVAFLSVGIVVRSIVGMTGVVVRRMVDEVMAGLGGAISRHMIIYQVSRRGAFRRWERRMARRGKTCRSSGSLIG